MSFRSRVAVLVALAVAGAFLLASLAMFATTRRSLLHAVDQELLEAVRGEGPGDRPAALVALREFVDQRDGRPNRPRPVPPRVGGAGGDALRGLGLMQVIRDGQVVATFPQDAEPLPVDAALAQAALDGGRSAIATIRTDESTYRVVVAGVGERVVVQVARPIDDIEKGLSGMARQLGLVSLLGVALAFVAGRALAGRILRPVQRLTTTAELIADTQDLAHRADVSGDDELARLATSLNRMLTALDVSRQAQQQLVADASHELRTPLTSLRTNVELLASVDQLGAEDRAAMRRDVVDQIEEMTVLIGNLVDLARDGAEAPNLTEVRLDELVGEVVERQSRLSPQATITADLQPTTVRGEPDRLRRAVANLVDNAVKYAGDVGPVEVSTRAGVVEVRDHGPGVPAADRVHVFDRFWRAPSARAAPGSGLGLAIVAQVAAAHGGTAEVEAAPGGGALFRLRIDPVTATAA